MDREQEYVEHSGVRNSELGYFISSPALYKDYIVDRNKPESNESFFSLGSIVHCSILENEYLWSRFIFSKYDNPKSAQQKKFVDNCIYYFNKGLTDIDFIIIEALNNSYTTNKLSDTEKKKKATVLYDEFKARISFYIEHNDKTILPIREFIRFKKCVKSINNHKRSNYFLQDTFYKSENEFPIYWKFNNLEMKSKLDRIVFDKKTKTIFIIDLKTTGKPISKFKGSYNDYDYQREMAIYKMAIKWLIDNDSEYSEFKDYNIVIKLVVVETVSYFETTVINLPLEPIDERIRKLSEETLPDLEWHFENNVWNYSRKYFEGDGETTLIN